MHHTLPEAVLFDLDGTLIDTAPDFHAVINRLLAEQQRSPVSYTFLRRYVSHGARAMIAAAFQLTEQDSTFDSLHQRMLELYLQHLDIDTKPFTGIPNLLHWLGEQQIPWGIVTNKPECYTTPVMRGLNLQPAPGSIICPDHVKQKKPHPEALFLACQQLDCNPARSVYIGDHRRDIEAGLSAGMQTIGVSYGYLDEHEDIASWNSHFQVDHADQIRPILETLYCNR
ncbi:HAD-IA family hydrolase [Amphritea sp. 1_MG-2023]|uniref:HAD-IA family hydrolase n=1 Tax=Amphritea sp. 1_MG-2023 TaxID=3062670 RepID=UPI0026E13564|nr:HAD-IA family hydrolase [Amphritea sp. 1_MG-2023]MDO6562774.1 HAD-IA family hydrolase [Amphritea sp. 1_MG-2023]